MMAVLNSIYKKNPLTFDGLDKENLSIYFLLLLLASIMGSGIYYFQGNVALVAGIFYLTFVLFLSLFRPDYSLILCIFTVLLFDQLSIPGFPTITREVSFFSNLKEISYVPFFNAGMISPFEIHTLFIVFSLFLHITVRKDFALKPIPVWGAFILFFTSLIMSFLNGIFSGGDFMIALWEVRALFYFCIIYLIVPQILDSKKHITLLVWIIITGITIKALQAVIRFVELGFTTGRFETLTNHEDPVFMVTLFILLIGFLIYNTNHKQKSYLLIFLFFLLLGFYVGQRRAAYASLMVSIPTVFCILPNLKRIQFLKYFLPVLAFLVLYGFIFWNHTGTLGKPVQMIKTGLVEPDKDSDYKDYTSNLYRDYENYNLARTVVNHTIIGTGFGKKYDQPIPLLEIPFPLRDYVPHNQILWVLVKMGAGGFFTFWFFFNCFVAKGTHLFNHLKDPYLKAVTIVIITAVINQMVVSFFDLQLSYYRNMIYLGSLMGLLPVIEHINKNSKKTDNFSKESSDE